MPLITTSGREPAPYRSGQIARSATFTQSAGRPSTAMPVNDGVRTVRVISGAWKVMPWPDALWTVSGATTMISPSPARASCSAAMPGASMPSSLVSRMRMGQRLPPGSARTRRLARRGKRSLACLARLARLEHVLPPAPSHGAP